MLFRRRHGDARLGGGQRPGDGPAERQGCPSLERAVEHALRKPKPEILDLGPMCGATVVYLAGRGARVTVEDFDPPPPVQPAADDDTRIPPRPIEIKQPDGKFDLVLVWEQVDFIGPEQLPSFTKELRRVLADDGWLLLLSRSSRAAGPERRAWFRVVADDAIVREPLNELPRRRWAHPTRDLERAMEGFSIKGIHLQRNQTREILATKKPITQRQRKPPRRASRREPNKPSSYRKAAESR